MSSAKVVVRAVLALAALPMCASEVDLASAKVVRARGITSRFFRAFSRRAAKQSAAGARGKRPKGRFDGLFAYCPPMCADNCVDMGRLNMVKYVRNADFR